MTRARSCVACGSIFLGDGARCADCRRDWQRRYNEARPEHHRLYASVAWRHLSAEVRREATRCHWCLRPFGPGVRSVADHVIPIEERPDLALDPSNVRAACNG